MTTASSPPHFGYLLRRYRLAAELTQEELAEKAYLSARAISDLERGVKRMPRRDTVALLADALELTDEDRAKLEASIRRTSAPGPLQPQLTNLPQRAPVLIGRDADMAHLSTVLRQADTRLVTLTGPGGVGKTRLALEAGAALLEAFEDGVWLVSLGPIVDPALVTATVARALEVVEAGDEPLLDALCRRLRDRRLLVILDNFEQVLDARSIVRHLLAASAGLTVLVTSRVALRLEGEQLIVVPPLELPSLRSPPAAEELGRIGSVALFLQRAQAVRADARLTEETAQTIAEICLRLDGLPLAIELAAARSRLLSPRALLQRLEPRLTLLGRGSTDLPARQQTMWRAIDWSYALLNPAEQAVFAQLSVFAGGCTIDAVEAVCQGDQGALILDALEGLVEQSLVAVQGGDEPRCVMLDTIREFAPHCLETWSEPLEVRRRHARYYGALAERAGPELTGPKQKEWLVLLEEEHNNLRAALRWLLDHGEMTWALRITGSIWRFWQIRGHLTEGQRWLTESLAGVDPPPTQARVHALRGAGVLAWAQGDYDRADAHLTAGLAQVQSLGDSAERAKLLADLGNVALRRGDYVRAVNLHEESLGVRRALDDGHGIALALNDLGIIAGYQEDYPRAVSLFEESLSLLRTHGDQRATAVVLGNLGETALHQGDYQPAREYQEESLAIARELGYADMIARTVSNLGAIAAQAGEWGVALEALREGLALFAELGDRQAIAESLEAIGRANAEEGQAEVAVRLWGAANELRHALGAPIAPRDLAERETWRAVTRSRLSEETWRMRWQEGHTMSLEQAIALDKQS